MDRVEGSKGIYKTFNYNEYRHRTKTSFREAL